MGRFRFTSVLFLGLATSVFLSEPAFAAAKAYTTDTQEVALNSLSGGKGRTILMIPPGSALELVNPNGWTHVRFAKPDGQVRDGWVQNKFLESRPSDSSVVKGLNDENGVLKDQLSAADKEKAGFSQKEKDLAEKLAKMTSAYEELKGGSTNFLKLKTEYDATKTNLASAQENIQNLIQENENLKLSQRIQWFVAGAAVLFFGLFLGWVTGRRQKKKRSNYY